MHQYNEVKSNLERVTNDLEKTNLKLATQNDDFSKKSARLEQEAKQAKYEFEQSTVRNKEIEQELLSIKTNFQN